MKTNVCGADEVGKLIRRMGGGRALDAARDAKCWMSFGEEGGGEGRDGNELGKLNEGACGPRKQSVAASYARAAISGVS